MTRVCSINGCLKPVYVRSWCCAHYRRWQRNGDPTAGRTPNGEPLEYIEEVANAHDADECLIWPFSCFPNGYAQVHVNGEPKGVHRIICEMARGPAPSDKHEAAHSCRNGQKGCIAKAHLRWATSEENQHDRLRDGTDCRGEKHGRAKLTEADVRMIRRLSGALKQKEIGARFGIAQATVSKIVRREKWSHVTRQPSIMEGF